MDRHDRNLIVIDERAQCDGILTRRIGSDHDLNAVVTESRRDLEGRRGRLGKHRGG